MCVCGCALASGQPLNSAVVHATRLFSSKCFTFVPISLFCGFFAGAYAPATTAGPPPAAMRLWRLALKCLRTVIAPSAAASAASSSSSSASALSRSGSGNRKKRTQFLWQVTCGRQLLSSECYCGGKSLARTNVCGRQLNIYATIYANLCVCVCVAYNFFLYEFLTNYIEQTNAWLKCLNHWMVEWIAGKQVKVCCMCVCENMRKICFFGGWNASLAIGVQRGAALLFRHYSKVGVKVMMTVWGVEETHFDQGNCAGTK